MKFQLKSLLSLLLAVTMLFCNLPLTALNVSADSQGSCGTNLTWTFTTATGKIVISGSGAMEDYAAASDAPWNAYSSMATSVEIGNSVTKIGNRAFESMTTLTKVTIGSGVKTIGNYAFYRCNGLAAVLVPNTVTSIGTKAFGFKVASGNEKMVGGFKLYGYSGSAAITYANNNLVDYVVAKTGIDYSNIGDINSVNTDVIDTGSCSTNLIWKYNNTTKVLTIGGTGSMADFTTATDSPWYPYYNLAKEIVVKGTVTRIGNNAFSGFSSVTKVTLGSGIKTIGGSAFYGCTFLSAVLVPNTVTSIGSKAFGYRTYSTGERIIPGFKLYGYNGSAAITYAKNYLIDYKIANTGTDYSNITEINTITTDIIDAGNCNNNILWKYNNTTKVLTVGGVGSVIDFENSSSAPWYAYYTTAKEIVVNGTVARIGNNAFNGFSTVTKVTIEDGVKEIGSNAFYRCTSLSAVLVPNTVTSIGSKAFGYRTYSTGERIIPGFKLYGYNGSAAITYAKNYLIDYEIANTGTDYSNITEINTITTDAIDAGNCDTNIIWKYNNSNNVLTIGGAGAMIDFENSSSAPWYAYYTTAKEIVVNGTVTRIGNNAFSGFSDITKVTIEDGVKEIGNYAFYRCTKLSAVLVPKSVTLIGTKAFGYKLVSGNERLIAGFKLYGYSGTAAITYASTSLVDYEVAVTGKDYSNITEINTVTNDEITAGNCGANATWKYNANTGVITIGGTGAMTDFENSSSAPWYAYYSTAKEVVINGTVTKIGNNAFSGMSAITKITIKSGVKTIGDRAFYGCTKLSAVYLPASITSVGAKAFGYKTVTGNERLIGGFKIYAPAGSAGLSYAQNNLLNYEITKTGTDYSNVAENNTITDEIIVVSSCGTGTLWTYSSATAVLTVGGTGAMDDYTSGNSPFYTYYNAAKKIVVKGTVTKIGNNAFNGFTALEKVTIEDGVNTIGNYAFYHCSKLSAVLVPSSVTSIGTKAFGYKLVSGNERLISGFKLYGYNGTAAITYAITALVNYEIAVVGNDYSNITEINTVTDEEITAGNCGDSTIWKYNFTTGVLSIGGTGAMNDYNAGNSPFYTYYNSAKEVVVKGTVTKIGNNAFNGFTGLQKVTIENGVKTVGDYAFYKCPSLAAVYLPSSVTSVGARAFGFKENSGLEAMLSGFKIYAPANSAGLTYAKNNLVGHETAKAGIDYSNVASSTQITNDIIYSGRCGANTVWAFNMVTGLLTVGGIGNTSDFALASDAPWSNYASMAKEILVKGTVTGIGDHAFEGCSTLTKVTIESGVRTIGDYAFYRCNILPAVLIPKSVTSIGNMAFGYKVVSGNERLVGGFKIYAYKDTEAINYAERSVIDYEIALDGNDYSNIHNTNQVNDAVIDAGSYETAKWKYDSTNKILTVYGRGTLPDASSQADISWSNYAGFATKIVVRGELINIPDYAFKGFSAVTSIQIPTSVVTIGNYAFSGCIKVSTFESGSFSSIGKEAFYNCKKLPSVVLKNGLKSIGDYAFYKCETLGNITIPSTVTSIGEYAFFDATKLKTVTFGNALQTIGNFAFANCTLLNQVILPNTIISIGNNAFYRCSAIQNLIFGTSVQTIGEQAFLGVTEVKNVEFGVMIRTIGSAALGYSESMSKVQGYTIYGYANSAAEEYAIQNGFTFVPVVASDPCDLNVTMISANQSTVVDGDDIKFYCMIRNTSDIDSSGVIKVDFYYNGKIFDTVYETSSIPAGGFKVIQSQKAKSTFFGVHKIQAIVNSGGGIKETDYTNNSLKSRLVVSDY